MLELLTIIGIFLGLCAALYCTIKIFPIDIDIDRRFEKKERLVETHYDPLT